jgi:hypothetical protein
MGLAASVASLGTRFAAQLAALTAAASNNFQASTLQQQRQWDSPDRGTWSGNPSDLVGLSQAFDRTANAQDYKNAVRNTEQPGVVGDMMASQIQGDYLAVQERAYRARLQSSVRCQLHAGARNYGHGHSAGLFQQGVLGYLLNLLKAAKSGKTTQ